MGRRSEEKEDDARSGPTEARRPRAVAGETVSPRASEDREAQSQRRQSAGSEPLAAREAFTSSCRLTGDREHAWVPAERRVACPSKQIHQRLAVIDESSRAVLCIEIFRKRVNSDGMENRA